RQHPGASAVPLPGSRESEPARSRSAGGAMIDLRAEFAARWPFCTSENITLSNLDLQLSNLRYWYAQTQRVDAGIQLAQGLLSRYSVSARDADLDDVDALTYALVDQAPADPLVWLARAE